MSGNIVNQEKCKKCKLCIEVCPVKMIGIDDAGLVNFIPERESICLKCGQCMAVCTSGAVKIASLNYEDDFIKRPDNPIDYENFMDFLANRRSVRNFKNKPVEKEVIENILKSLEYAPYGANPNAVEITIVNNRKKTAEILPLIEKFLDAIPGWVDNPIVSRIIKLKKGNETFNTLKNHLYPMIKLENYKLSHGDRISRSAPALMIFHADKNSEEHTNNALIYATYAMLALHAAGLGGTMNGIIPASIDKVPEIKKKLNIPTENEAVISIIFGYPKYKYNKTVIRKKTNIHWIE